MTNQQLAEILEDKYLIANALDLVEVSHQPNRPTLARMLALTENETSGSRDSEGRIMNGGVNVYGGEGPCPELYEHIVTEENYQTYKEARERGEGNNGVGPVQITSTGLQVLAQEKGGCWDARHSMEVGYGFLHELIQESGVWEGFRRYNGSGPEAEAYARLAVERTYIWEERLQAIL